jgi:hypothetical protein
MLKDWISLSRDRCLSFSCAFVVSMAILAFSCDDRALAKSPARALRGLFCNTADQIDEALTHMRMGFSPRAAAGLVNRDAVACTFVDTLHYVVDRPTVVSEIGSNYSPLFKHRGTLVAVIVGGAMRRVTPPASIFFAIPERLDDAIAEKGV